MQKYFVTFLQGYPLKTFLKIFSYIKNIYIYTLKKILHKIERPLTARGGGGFKALNIVLHFFQAIPDDTPLDNFRVPVDSVERAAGLLFFDR